MTTPPGSTGPNGNADRVWLRTDLPMEARVEALLAEMTLAEKVGQTHQSANIDPIAGAELIRGGGIGSSLLASGATGTATFEITPAQLSYYDRTMTLRIDPGLAVVTVGPDATNGASVRITVIE